MSDTIYWIWLATKLGVASRHLHYLLDRYSSAYDIFRADPEELEMLDLKAECIAALSDKDLRQAYAINDYCVSHKIGILTYSSEHYPAKLRFLKDPPAVLYFRGVLPNVNDFLSIGVVGTRKISEYGKRSAYKIAYELGAAGVTVVSGMASGIDGVSACGAICGGGKTIAVLGSGIDVIYPKEHTKLYNKIIENGAVVSEYPPTTKPLGQHFPVRNRIISGLSNGTLVIEGDLRSGSLITARRALVQGRDLFALPGNLGNKNSSGTNQLLHDGANLVIETEDILKPYEFYYGNTINYLGLHEAKGRSELDSEALSRMGVYFEMDDTSSQEVKHDVITVKENKLRPRKIPKNKTEKDQPSTLSPQTITENKAEQNKKDTSSLSEVELKVLSSMPDDRAVSVDALMRFGFSASEIMGTLAMLEIKGFVSSLPGGLYIKA